MKNDKDEVALQGIEFWSTVCDEEADLAIEAIEAAESGHPPEQTSRFYVKGAMPFLVPILLVTLIKQVSVWAWDLQWVCSDGCGVEVRRSMMMKMTGTPARQQVYVCP